MGLSILLVSMGCSPAPAPAPPVTAASVPEPTPTPAVEDPAPAASATPEPPGGGQIARCDNDTTDHRCRLCVGAKPILEIVPGDMASFPEKASTLAESKPAKGPRDLTYRIASDGSTLAAQVLTCPGCRRQMGWGVRVGFEDLKKLGADDRAALQDALGWPKSPLLDSAEAWQRTAPTGVPHGFPTLPSCKPVQQ